MSADEPSGLAHSGRRHVVEHDDVGAGGDGGGDHRQRLGLDLDEHIPSDAFARAQHGQPDAPGLSPRASASSAFRWLSLISTWSYKPHPVIGPAARADGVFFQRAEAGRGLPRVEDLHVAARDRLDAAAGQRRDAAQPLDEVERRPLARQQRADRADDLRDFLAAAHAPAVGGQRLEGRAAG